MTPRTRSTARSVTRRSSWTEDNLESLNGAPAISVGGVASPIGGVCVATSRHKSQDVVRAHHCEKDDGMLRSRVFLKITAKPSNNVYRVVLSLKTL